MGVHGDIDSHLALWRGDRFSPFELRNRLRDQFRIEIESDGGNVPALHLTQDGTGSPDLQVAQGKLEPRSQIGRLADCLEPPVGILGQGLIGGMEEVSVCPLAGSAHPAPELIELGETEQVGPFHDQGVDLGQVEPGLDDGGRHHDVVLAVPEVDHHLFQLALGHLAVCDHIAGVGDKLLESGHGAVDRLDPVVHVEDLAFPEQLTTDGSRHCLVVVRADVGQDRMTVLWWGPDVGDLADPGEGHLQCSRDRSCGESEHVDAHLESFDRVLRRNSESLLLIDHEEPECLEVDVLG